MCGGVTLCEGVCVWRCDTVCGGVTLCEGVCVEV